MQQTDIEIGNSLGAIGITIHILLSIPLLVYLCSGRAVQIGGTFISIVSDTLNSWFLIIQVSKNHMHETHCPFILINVL